MNILLINHYAGCPECGMEFRPYYLAWHWQKLGHKTIIVAASHSHLRRKNPVLENNLQTEIIDGIEYLWVKTPSYTGNGLDRIKNMLSFVHTLKKNAKFIAEKYQPDIVIASSTYPMDIAPAKKIARLANAKLIFEIHDLWPLSPMELGGYSKYHPFIMYVQHYENMAYKHADAVVSILPKTKEHCIEHGLKPEKWFHVPNGIFEKDWKQTADIPAEHKQKLQELKNKRLFLIAYTGNLGVANDLYTFIDTKKYLKNSDIAIILLGKGTEKERLKDYVQKQNYQNVYFFDAIEKNAIPEFLKYVDAVYIGLKKQPLFRFGVSPNKLFDYMMAKKPIIYAVEAGNDLVKEANAGISVEPENPRAIAQAIDQLASMPSEKLKEMGENGYKFVIENHTYEKLAQRFLNVMQKIRE